jgi:hypothetical protein
MLLRILLLLMLALQALPATAAPACHPAPIEMAGMDMAGMHHHRVPAPAPVQLPGEQHCIGCVAPSTAKAPELAQPLPFARVPAPRTNLSGADGIAVSPALPPPRSAA